MAVAGVDGCRRGWVAVVLRPNETPAGHLLSRITDLERVAPDVEIVAIDIPIGLPETGAERPSDVLARKFVGARRNSVFPTPRREVLQASSALEANALSRSLTGKGLSAQSFALREKILEVDAWSSRTPFRVFEVHPEVSFAVMMGAPAGSSKAIAPGLMERRDALERAGIVLDHIFANPTMHAGLDDILDAGAAAWTASRLASGSARSFPDPPVMDSSGRQVAIWA